MAHKMCQSFSRLFSRRRNLSVRRNTSTAVGCDLQPRRQLGFRGGELARKLIVLRLKNRVLLRENRSFVFQVVEIVAAQGSALGGFAQRVAGFMQRFLAERQTALGDGKLLFRARKLLAKRRNFLGHLFVTATGNTGIGLERGDLAIAFLELLPESINLLLQLLAKLSRVFPGALVLLQRFKLLAKFGVFFPCLVSLTG